jgi:hypothetical protein
MASHDAKQVAEPLVDVWSELMAKQNGLGLVYPGSEPDWNFKLVEMSDRMLKQVLDLLR